MARQAASDEHRVDQGAADAAVAVLERVDRLELRVHQPGLHERSVDAAVHVGDKVGDQRWDTT